MTHTSTTIQFIKTVIPNTVVRRLFFITLWTVVGLLSATHWRYFPTGDYPYTWWELVRAKIFVWWLWGAFVFPILALAARYKIESPKIARSVAILFGWSLLITVIYLVCYTGTILINFTIIHAKLRPLDWPNWENMLGFIFRAHSTYYYLAFWLVVAVEHAFAYYMKYNEREMNASRLQSQLVQAQLENLKSQLQPHFLFNSFNTISSLILDNKKEEAAELIAELSDLLRLSLQHSSQQFVSLQSELEFLRKYLSLIQARFGNRLHVTMDIESTCTQAEVPALLLQPMVENAVKHGTGLYLGKSSIDIAASRIEDNLNITITNELLNAENQEKLPSSSGFGIGLKNTEKRLRHLFENNYSLQRSTPNENAYEVMITIPFKLISNMEPEHD